MTLSFQAVLGGLSGGSVDKLVLAAVGALGAFVLLLILRQSAKSALVVWLCAVCFVPCWFIINIKFPFPVATLVGLLAFAAILPVVPRPFTWPDWLAVFLLVACVAPTSIGAATLTTVFVALTQWGLGFALGRMLPLKIRLQTIYNCLAVVCTIVAAAALVEFFFHWNPFVQLTQHNALYQVWSPLQERGGVVRAEGAFGHSIALGASIALVIPLTLATRFKPGVRSVMVMLMLGASVVTFSRIGIVASLLGLLLTLAFVKGHGIPARLRVGLVVILGIAAIAVQSSVMEVFSDAGSEAANSAAYRLDLSALLPDMVVLGVSPNLHRTAAGETLVGTFGSVDSAWLLLGLLYGILALVVGTALYLSAVAVMLRGRATAPTVAVVAQLPALIGVALITQYAMFFWFVAGLAVASQSLARAPARGTESAQSPTRTTPPPLDLREAVRHELDDDFEQGEHMAPTEEAEPHRGRANSKEGSLQ